jgi:hypothetical protein
MACFIGYKPRFKDVLMVLSLIKGNEYDFNGLYDVTSISRENLNILLNHICKWDLVERRSVGEKLSILPKGNNILRYSYKEHAQSRNAMRKRTEIY